ncbi:MAG: WYL domain-containing protein [Flavobacteriia bacterium]|nr:WYL domain-containing protein [Flavobacteriia bacterium]
MNLNASLPRYAVIIETIVNNEFASGIQISRKLADRGFEATSKSLKKDIADIRDTFDIDILYHKVKDAYFISEAGKEATDRFLDFIGVSRVSEIVGQALQEQKEVSPYLSFEHEGQWAGTRWLPDLVKAVKSHKWVGFDYRKFETDLVKHYSLMPLLLKQYQGRWYLVGQQQNGEDRTFGIDRIEELKVRDQSFTPPEGDPRDRFRNVVGLNHSRDKVETVRFSCEPVQAQYLKTLPLHRSQKIIRDGKLETVFEVKVIPNYEFVQRILMMGAKIKVIQPSSLATEIYSHLLEAAKQYES